MPASKTPSPRSPRLVTFALSLALGCHSTSAPPVDAGVDARAVTVDAGPRGRARRGRRRRPRAQVAAAAPGDPAPEPAPTDDEEPAPARPRMVETGPTLPEDLGPAPSMELDLANGAQGPMGLEPGQVRRGLDPLLPRLAACAEATADANGHGARGRVSVRLRVRGDGRPTAARVSGGGGGPDFVLCVRRVIASARFDRFAGPDVFVTWGFDVD